MSSRPRPYCNHFKIIIKYCDNSKMFTISVTRNSDRLLYKTNCIIGPIYDVTPVKVTNGLNPRSNA